MAGTDKFDCIVELDIIRRATDDEVDTLVSEPEEWRRLLLAKLAHLDGQFTERKAESIANGSKSHRAEYELWKSGAMGRKRAIVERLAEAKAIYKQDNREKFDRQGSQEIMARELIAIRGLLEKLVVSIQQAENTKGE